MSHCTECGGKLKKIGDIGNTRKCVCSNCYEENIKYINPEPCEHEYNDKSGNKCIHCGEPSIHYADQE